MKKKTVSTFDRLQQALVLFLQSGDFSRSFEKKKKTDVICDNAGRSKAVLPYQYENDYLIIFLYNFYVVTVILFKKF